MSILPSILRPFPSLEPLPDPDLLALSKVLHTTQFRSGSQICREGDSGDACYFLVEGEVEVTTQLSDGRRIFLATLQPGTLFGQGALAHGRLRSADVRATCNVQVLALNRIDHQWALKLGARWAVHLQKLVCIYVIRQLRSAITQLRELAEGGTLEVEQNQQAYAPGPEAPSTPLSSPPRSEDTLLDGGHDASTTGRLITLIAETEATLAGEGVDLDAVQFVVDPDAAYRRRRPKL